MNKELKFKVFWLEDKIITNVDTIEFLNRGIRVTDGCCHMGWLSKDCILIEYTGLKDIHGNEIYNGDIITLDGCRFDTAIVAYFDGRYELRINNNAVAWGLNENTIREHNVKVIKNKIEGAKGY